MRGASRGPSWSTWCAVILLAIVPAIAAGDEVDVWLERRGLNRLLAEHLEQRLPTLSGEARGQAAIQLARLYAELLSETEDRAERISLEERGRRLLEEVTGMAANALRLELCHGAYLGIEQSGERHRIRLLEAAEQARTIERLEDLIGEMSDLRKKIDVSAQRARKTAGNRASRRSSGQSRLDSLEEMLNRIDFLLGWCQYYRAWLTGQTPYAERAEQHFASILDLEEFTPGDVSQDLRSERAIAWTIIGMAMANSVTSSAVSALRWLDLLDLPNVPVDIRDQLPGWRLAVLLEHRQFDEAFRLLRASGNQVAERPVAWVRMAAVHALENTGDPAADALAAEALADLASMGELGQIQDIVGRFGQSAGGDRFPFRYARAIIDYRAARELEDRVPEVAEPDRLNAWRVAAKAIEQALSAPDADQFGAARQQAKLLYAWSVYYLDRFEDARNLFEEVAGFLPEADASEAIWMAYVSEERRCERDRSATDETMNRLVDLYLERFPGGMRAGELMVRRASRGEEPSRERIEELLRVPLDSPARPLAQMRAADMLYRLFRAAKGQERVDVASDYLVVAVPMMQEDYSAAGEVAGARSVARARRVLEVATDPDVLRLVAADSALLVLLNRDVLVQVEDQDLEDEVDYRRILLALARDDTADAQAIIETLYQRRPDAIWTRLATRRALDRARQDCDQAEGEAVRDALKRIMVNGNRLLAESATLQESLESRIGLSVASAVASAATDLWLQGGDASAGDRAWELYGALLEHSPRNRVFLAGRGRLAASRGDTEEALRCWRIVTVGSRSGSDDWFEARTALVEILEKADPERAREVMVQHRALYPEYGPAPWGDRLRQAAIRLGVGGADASEPPGEDGE
ncbi:MAG: hypothetical protein MK116_07455 [Phycisphaerales bacterium]|nr:hypothetical protein [Phycisphaerales bacterium]